MVTNVCSIDVGQRICLIIIKKKKNLFHSLSRLYGFDCFNNCIELHLEFFKAVHWVEVSSSSSSAVGGLIISLACCDYDVLLISFDWSSFEWRPRGFCFFQDKKITDVLCQSMGDRSIYILDGVMLLHAKRWMLPSRQKTGCSWHVSAVGFSIRSGSEVKLQR